MRAHDEGEDDDDDDDGGGEDEWSERSIFSSLHSLSLSLSPSRPQSRRIKASARELQQPPLLNGLSSPVIIVITALRSSARSPCINIHARISRASYSTSSLVAMLIRPRIALYIAKTRYTRRDELGRRM